MHLIILKYQDIILSRIHIIYPRIVQLEKNNIGLSDLNAGKIEARVKLEKKIIYFFQNIMPEKALQKDQIK